MSGRNVIALDQNRRSRRPFPDQSTIAILIFLIFDSMILAGMIGAFMLTRAAAEIAWPPAGQPWFPLEYAVINTAILLVGGMLVWLAGRAWEKQSTRIGPYLSAAIVLGIFFVIFQVVEWLGLISQGLSLSASQQGNLFCLIVATHVAHVVGAVIFLNIAWRRMKPLRDDDLEPRGLLHTSTFLEARLLWYFTTGIWPVLYVCLF